ncbi:hypothetical protein AcW1_003994 [Taiwanofungus camphoratus]|nr:hypothetical protein AcW1_003994 [Antrodia cinnamomea]
MLQYHDFLKDIKLNGCKLDLRGSLLLDLEGTHASASFFVSLQHAPHHPFVFLACLNDTDRARSTRFCQSLSTVVTPDKFF